MPAAAHICSQRQGAGHIEPQVVVTLDRLLNLQRAAAERTHREDQFGVGLDAAHPFHCADGGGACRSQERVLRKFRRQLVGGEAQRHSGAGGAARVHLQQQVVGRHQVIGVGRRQVAGKQAQRQRTGGRQVLSHHSALAAGRSIGAHPGNDHRNRVHRKTVALHQVGPRSTRLQRQPVHRGF